MDSGQLENNEVPPDENADSAAKIVGFTSENFKVEITNLPRFYGVAQFKKLLKNQFKIEHHKLKPVPARGCLFVTFENEEKRLQAVKLLNGYQWKKSKLTVRCVSAAADPFYANKAKRRIEEVTETSNQNKKIRFDDDDCSVESELREVTVPWWNVAYDEQLRRKNNTVQEFIKRYKNMLRTHNFPLFNWLCRKNDGRNDICVDAIQPSPITDKYRNKCEFTVGYHPVTGRPTVGFRLGSYKQSSVGVVSPQGLPHVPDCMQRAVQLFQRFVDSSSHAPFDPCLKQGHWRQLLVRCSRTGHTMLVVQFERQTLSEQEIIAEQRRLGDFVAASQTGDESERDAAPVIKSLYWQTLLQKVSADQRDTRMAKQLLYGDQFLDDRLFDLQLRVSPEAFLQVNSAAAEVLYRAVFQMASVRINTTLLDVCCGTGTIGLSFASFLRQQLNSVADSRAMSCGSATPSSTDSLTVPTRDDTIENVESVEKGAAANSPVQKPVCNVVGVELVPEAVADAVANASTNRLSDSCRFFVGRAEKLLATLLDDQCATATTRLGQDVVAVVDPPRAGLGRHVSQTLRRCSALRRLVYVACDPNQAMPNLLDLARPTSKQYRHQAFVVRHAVPVDLFPHTPNVELALLLERCDPTEEIDPASENMADSTSLPTAATGSARAGSDDHTDHTVEEKSIDNKMYHAVDGTEETSNDKKMDHTVDSTEETGNDKKMDHTIDSTEETGNDKKMDHTVDSTEETGNDKKMDHTVDSTEETGNDKKMDHTVDSTEEKSVDDKTETINNDREGNDVNGTIAQSEI